MRSRPLLYAMFSLALLLPPFLSLGPMSAAAADDCASLRAQIFGTGPSDRESAQFQYNNLKSALAKSKASLAVAEQNLEAARKTSAAYFLEHGQTHGLLEFQLHSASERAREDRANVQYYTQRLNSAAAKLRRLSAEYKRLNCAGKKASANGEWAGTYANSSQEVTVTGEGGSLTAKSKYTEPGHSFEDQGGTNAFDPCKPESDSAFKCKTAGEYHDADKTIDSDGTSTLTFSGQSLTISEKIDSTTCKPKKKGIENCSQLGYTPRVTAGANFTATFKRQ